MSSNESKNNKNHRKQKLPYNAPDSRFDPTKEFTPCEIALKGDSKEELERAMKKLSKMIKKEGIFEEFMWRTHKRDSREKKKKYFK